MRQVVPECLLSDLTGLGDGRKRRVAAVLLVELSRELSGLAHLGGRITRQPDHTALLADRTVDCLPHPPIGVGAELVAPLCIKASDGCAKADQALLHQVFNG